MASTSDHDTELWDAYDEGHQEEGQAPQTNGVAFEDSPPPEYKPKSHGLAPSRKTIDYHGFIDVEMLQESNLVRHAMRELRLLGESPRTIAGYLQMIKIFADMGHSGGSASIFTQTLNDLLQFNNLRPLTNDPAEWQYVGAQFDGQDMWQNTRNGKAFSTDMGKTYSLLEEAQLLNLDKDTRIIHTSKEYNA